MEFGCPTGALIQPFVIQAIESYSKQVIAAGPAHFDSDLLSGEAWVATAKHALTMIEERV